MINNFLIFFLHLSFERSMEKCDSIHFPICNKFIRRILRLFDGVIIFERIGLVLYGNCVDRVGKALNSCIEWCHSSHFSMQSYNTVLQFSVTIYFISPLFLLLTIAFSAWYASVNSNIFFFFFLMIQNVYDYGRATFCHQFFFFVFWCCPDTLRLECFFVPPFAYTNILQCDIPLCIFNWDFFFV